MVSQGLDQVEDRPALRDRVRYGLVAAGLLLGVELAGDLVYGRLLSPGWGKALDPSWLVACVAFGLLVDARVDRDAGRARSSITALAGGAVYFAVGVGLWMRRLGLPWGGAADSIRWTLAYALALDWTLTAAVVIAYAAQRWAARHSPPVADWMSAAEEDDEVG